MDFKKMFAVLVVALFLLSSISFAYAEDSSEDMDSDVVQTSGYSGSGHFMEDAYSSMGLIKTIVNSEDYDFSLSVKSCETNTLVKSELFTFDSGWKMRLSEDLNVCEKNFNIFISHFKKESYLGKDFWDSVNDKQDSFKKNIDNAKKQLNDNNLLLASAYIANAQKDLQNITVSALSLKLKHDQEISLFWEKLNKLEKDFKDYSLKVGSRNIDAHNKKEFTRYMYKARVHMDKGDLWDAFQCLNHAESTLKKLKR